ncbi:MAG: MFS transporter [Burkholderiales bacterium]|nr:MFS transporter [Burkholderiales bacterium]
MSEPAMQASTREAFFLALWLNLVMALVSFCMTAVPVMAPAIAEHLGVDAGLLGVYTALTWGASIASSALAGRLGARLGALRVCQACLAICALAILAGVSGPVLLLALAAMLLGFGMGAETPATATLLARITPPRQRTFIFSLKQTGGQIGGVLGGFVFPALLPLIGWRGAWFTLLPLVLLLALALERPRRRYEPRHAARAAVHASSFRPALSLIANDVRLLRLAFVVIAYITLQIYGQVFVVTFLVKEAGFSLALAGMMLAAVQAGGLIGRLVWGALCSRGFPAVTALVTMGLGASACSSALGLWAASIPPPLLAALCFLFGATAAGWQGVLVGESARLVPLDALGQVTGAMMVVGTAGLLLGPIAFAALAAATSYGAAYVAAAAFGLAGAAVLLAGTRR